MNKFITFTLVLFALAARGSCYGGSAVQQISVDSMPNIENILNGASNSYGGPSPAYVASAGPAVSVSTYGNGAGNYGGLHALAPASSIVPSASSYSGYSGAGYGLSRGYGNGASRVSIQPAISTELYPGQHNYKAYASPTQHSRVAVPILPTEPVAKLFMNQQSSYGGSAAY